MTNTTTITRRFHKLTDIETITRAEAELRWIHGWEAQRDTLGHLGYDKQGHVVFVPASGSGEWTCPSIMFRDGFRCYFKGAKESDMREMMAEFFEDYIDTTDAWALAHI